VSGEEREGILGAGAAGGTLVTVFLTAGGILALDRWTKHLAESVLSAARSVPVFENVFHLTLVHNRGAAFGFLPDAAVFFIAAAVLSIGAIVTAFWRPRFFARVFGLHVTDARVRTALALVLGGALGNLIDRVRYGYVIDFLDFRVWPVFNIADTAITCGGIVIALVLIKEMRCADGSHTV
jgi:signal peptidase II